MIACDLSQICHAATHVLRGEILQSREDPQEIANILRHGILSQFRSIRGSGRFEEFGRELVVCCDSKVGYWRHDIFPYYKANRKKHDEDDLMPWEHIKSFFHSIRDDIREHFPYKVIEIPKLEADDIIAILVEDVANKNVIRVGLDVEPEPILIYGGDRDSIQLHKHRNVRQWSPILQKYIVPEKSADEDLRRKILKGDRGDGIPGIFSSENCFVDGIRQTPCTEKKMQPFLAAKNLSEMFSATEDAEILRRMKLNTRLVCFHFIPTRFRSMVVEAYQEKPKGTKLSAYKYLMRHNCNILANDIERF
jgi:hypothetical protein